ncbi:MAG: hypothetical protein AAGF30_06275 [Pseudomonadota bacterium]
MRDDDLLVAAHDAGDRMTLVTLYLRAADDLDGDARAFFLTQAWIFALEAGDPRADSLRATLSEMGRV